MNVNWCLCLARTSGNQHNPLLSLLARHAWHASRLFSNGICLTSCNVAHDAHAQANDTGIAASSCWSLLLMFFVACSKRAGANIVGDTILSSDILCFVISFQSCIAVAAAGQSSPARRSTSTTACSCTCRAAAAAWHRHWGHGGRHGCGDWQLTGSLSLGCLSLVCCNYSFDLWAHTMQVFEFA